MHHAPTPLLPWICERFAVPGKKVPDYAAAAADLLAKTGHEVEPDTLRQSARGYKRTGGLFAAAIQTWTDGAVDAATMLTWVCARDAERSAG